MLRGLVVDVAIKAAALHWNALSRVIHSALGRHLSKLPFVRRTWTCAVIEWLPVESWRRWQIYSILLISSHHWLIVFIRETFVEADSAFLHHNGMSYGNLVFTHSSLLLLWQDLLIMLRWGMSWARAIASHWGLGHFQLVQKLVARRIFCSGSLISKCGCFFSFSLRESSHVFLISVTNNNFCSNLHHSSILVVSKTVVFLRLLRLLLL